MARGLPSALVVESAVPDVLGMLGVLDVVLGDVVLGLIVLGDVVLGLVVLGDVVLGVVVPGVVIGASRRGSVVVVCAHARPPTMASTAATATGPRFKVLDISVLRLR